LKVIKKTLTRHCRPRAIVTDGLRSYGAALQDLGAPDLQAPVGRWNNNRAENSHLPFRRRERAMARFRRMKTLQKFSSVHAQVHNHFSQERHLVSREIYKERCAAAALRGGQSWREAGGVWAPCVFAETSRHWTATTATQSGQPGSPGDLRPNPP
jgi:putative transposase